MSDPLVSIVMPAWQAERHIAEALRSAEAQDWPNIEIVLVDDGSTDGTLRIAEQVLSRIDRPGGIISQENTGAAMARDRGIAVATGEYVLLLDADDRCDPDHVSTLVAGIGDADVAFTRCRYVDREGEVETIQDDLPTRVGAMDLLNGVMVNTPLVRKSAIIDVGGHDAALSGSIDLDLLVRLSMRRDGAIRPISGVTSDYRRDSGQITSDWRRMERTWSRVRDKAVAAGLSIDARAASCMRGRHCAYWSTLAYKAGDYPAARALILEALRRVPAYVMRDDLARVRAIACATSLLPKPLHQRLRRWFNARNAVS